MNKRLFISALVIGVVVGTLVLHPLWVSLHTFDGMHTEDNSWLGFVIQAYREVFSFNDILHLSISVFVGFILSLFVMMFRTQRKKRELWTSVKSSLNLRVIRGIFWCISALQKDSKSYGYARFFASGYTPKSTVALPVIQTLT